MNAKVKRLKLLSSSNAQFSGVYVTWRMVMEMSPEDSN
jgi:hypothetical protein